MPKRPLTSRRRPEVVALALSPADPGAGRIDQHRTAGPSRPTRLVMPPDPGDPHDYRGDGGLCQTRSGCGRCVLSAGHYGDHDFGGAGRDATSATRGAWAPAPSWFDGAIPWPDGEPDPVPEPTTDYDVFLRRDMPRDRRAKGLADTMRSLCREFALFVETPRSVSENHGHALVSLQVGLRDVANAAGLLAQIEYLAEHPVNVRGDQ